MEEASIARTASLEAVADVESEPLGDEIGRIVDRASMTPGALTILTARTVDVSGRDGGARDRAAAAATRAAGVQLSYEGLRLTRQLVREDERWNEDDPLESNLALLVAEVMVSRGFFHLARTPVAPRAIEIVRRFSRNQLLEREFDAEPAELGPSLEEDVIELAVRAGATIGSEEVSPVLAEYAGDLARDLDVEPLPDPSDALAGVADTMETLLGAHRPAPAEDHSRAVDGSW